MGIRRPEIFVRTEERKKVRCLALCLRNCKCLINANDCIDGGLQQILTGRPAKGGVLVTTLLLKREPWRKYSVSGY